MKIFIICTAIALCATGLSGCAGMQPDRSVQEGAERMFREKQAQARIDEQKLQKFKAATKPLLDAVDDGRLPRSAALAAGLPLIEKHLGPLSPAQKELHLYTVTLFERHEAGELTLAQVEYLRTEKQNAINARLEQERLTVWQELQRGEERIDAEYARDSAVLQNIIYNNATQQQYRAPVTCYGNSVGGYSAVNCY